MRRGRGQERESDVLSQAIGDLLPVAVGVALSPIPIIAVILMLGTPKARVNGPAFVVGWIVGLVAVKGELGESRAGTDDLLQAALRLRLAAVAAGTLGDRQPAFRALPCSGQPVERIAATLAQDGSFGGDN